METLPIIREIGQLQTMAQIMFKSGFFKDAKDPAKAFVVIKAGEEMGIPAVASMRQIELINGQISIRAHLCAAMIRRSGRYDYRVRESTDKRCEIEFYRDGESIGTFEYTWDDAVKAKDNEKDNYKKRPKVMLYNRAMANGARMHCPDIFLGGVYVEGELEDEPNDPVYIDVEPDTNTEQRAPIPDMTQTQPKSEVAKPPSPAQLKKLIIILVQRGVRDGHKRELIARVMPGDQYTMGRMSFHIDALEGTDKLTESFMRHYARLLQDEHAIDNDTIMAKLHNEYNTDKVSALTAEQQKEMIAWLCGDDDIPVYKATKDSWSQLVLDVCKGTDTKPDDFVAWCLSTRGKDDTKAIHDLTQADFEELMAMSLDEIRGCVSDFVSNKAVDAEVI